MAENYSGKRFDNKAEGFGSPTQLPLDEDQARAWQDANRAWWERTPMRYDWREDVQPEPGSREYFEEIDRRFFASVARYMPWKQRPFDNLINFADLGDKDVLEIGVGYGSHAQLIARHCQSFTGIDLTQKATEMTSNRLIAAGLAGRILQMDAERMDFPDASFDCIWSWGVIHHSADTLRILREMNRVLRPNGVCVVMVYHRSLWKYYLFDGLFKGILRGDLLRKGSLHNVSQAATDGAIARYYKTDEWTDLCQCLFTINEIIITGQKSDVLPLPPGPVKTRLEQLLPDAVSRAMTNRFGMGSFLIARMQRMAAQ